MPHYNHRPIDNEIILSVMNFFYLFMLSFVVLALALGALGLDYMTAITGAATAICNVGPAMGSILAPLAPLNLFQTQPNGYYQQKCSWRST